MIETAFAKLNLALHVRKRRDDGYHEIETVFAFCAHGDTVSAEPAAATTLTIEGPFAEGLSTTDNLVVRAANALGVTARLHLTKRLPVASGIGGGSADAAAVLRMLDPERSDVLTVARALGADVPACFASNTVRATGIGDSFFLEPPVTGTPVLLANPRTALSTAAVFGAWGGIDRGPLGRWQDGRNDLEAPARTLVPVMGEVLDWLSAQPGVTTSRMSGSGATCFALFDTTAARDAAAGAVPRAWWHMASTLR